MLARPNIGAVVAQALRGGGAYNFMLVALVTFATAACDEDVFVKGIVRDPTGAPLEGVTVTFTSPGCRRSSCVVIPRACSLALETRWLG